MLGGNEGVVSRITDFDNILQGAVEANQGHFLPAAPAKPMHFAVANAS
jgi:hypothetical protein